MNILLKTQTDTLWLTKFSICHLGFCLFRSLAVKVKPWSLKTKLSKFTCIITVSSYGPFISWLQPTVNLLLHIKINPLHLNNSHIFIIVPIMLFIDSCLPVCPLNTHNAKMSYRAIRINKYLSISKGQIWWFIFSSVCRYLLYIRRNCSSGTV